MAYPIVLAVHSITAVLTVALVAYALYVLRYRAESSYRFCALALGFLAASEVFTGTALAVLSPTLSALSLTAHIVEYLGACALVEFFLFVRLRKTALAFPLNFVLSPVLASCLMFAAALSLNF